MKLTERVEAYRARAKHNPTQREVRLEAAQQRRLVRKQRLQQQVAAARGKLTPEDRALAESYRTPADLPARREAAVALRYVGDRRRTYEEIAAIMGISQSAVKNYFWDADGTKDVARKQTLRKASRSPGRPASRKPAELAPPAEPVGVRIHRRRRTRKLSQVKLAEQLGVPVERVRAWEAGEAKPTPAEYSQVAEALGL